MNGLAPYEEEPRAIHDEWQPPEELPLLGVSDTRNARWKAAEARIAKRHHDPDPADLAIVEEEQAAFDAANSEEP